MLFLPFVGGIIVAWRGYRALRSPDDLRYRDVPARRAIALGTMNVLAVVTSFIALIVAWNEFQANVTRVYCAGNMRQIGQAMLMYANENNGVYPLRLEDVLLHEDIGAVVFVCPGSDDEEAKGPTTAQAAANLTKPSKGTKHLSYVYVTPGVASDRLTPSIVVLYESEPNHHGINVLYGDGSAQWIDKKAARKLLSELAAGHNPPRAGEESK